MGRWDSLSLRKEGEGKYFFAEEKKYGEGNGGKYHGEGKIVAVGRK